jgi:hypothetical protein
MDMHSRNQLAKVVAYRYWKAAKKEKSVILGEFCLNTGYGRKYAIKKLRRTFLYRQTKKIGKIRRNKHSRYMIIKALIKQFWEVSDYPSGTRLAAILPELIKKGREYGEINPNPTQLQLLAAISISSIDRMLSTEVRARIRRLNGQTKGGKLKYDIPFAIDQEAIVMPGVLEIDLVSHCGESAMGEFIYTLNSTDMITGWYEAEAIMGKSQRAVDAALREIEARLPFKLMGIDSDNGTEFINWNLKRYADSRKITFTRSRPYKKNDNAHIEQKNFTHVRKVIGYMRLDTRIQQDMLNDLYRNELRLYINFFQPSQKLIKKERVGSKIRRVYDTAQTPYQRLVKQKDIPEEVKRKLREQYKMLNPFALKRTIDKKLRKIFLTTVTSA